MILNKLWGKYNYVLLLVIVTFFCFLFFIQTLEQNNENTKENRLSTPTTIVYSSDPDNH